MHALGCVLTTHNAEMVDESINQPSNSADLSHVFHVDERETVKKVQDPASCVLICNLAA